MDIKKLVESIKSFRPSRNALIAAGALVVAAAGGAYYFLVYEPEQEREAAAAKQPVVAKPKPAAAPAAAKPVAASGVPAAASGVPAAAKPGAASAVPAAAAEKMKPALAASAPAPTQAISPEPAKPDHAAEKPESKKHETATKTEQADKAGKESGTSNVKEESQAVREPAPVADAEPAASVATRVPVMKRGRIMPKYNDIMTAVLRGDRGAAKELLDLGWWVDKPGENGVTPLMAAVMNRDAKMVQLLLEYGAEPTSQALNLARKNKDTATAAILEQKGVR